jgi:hypothetical protein
MIHELNEANKFVARFFYPLPHNGYRSKGLMSIDRRWEDAKIVADIAIDMLQEAAEEWLDEEFARIEVIRLEQFRKQVKEL